MDDILEEVFGDIFEAVITFVRRWIAVILVAVAVVAILGVLWWNQHRIEESCQARGGVVVYTYGSASCFDRDVVR